MEVADGEDTKLESWHRQELIRLGFSRPQYQHVMALIDAGEADLAEIRDLVEKRGWTPDQAMMWLPGVG